MSSQEKSYSASAINSLMAGSAKVTPMPMQTSPAASRWRMISMLFTLLIEDAPFVLVALDSYLAVPEKPSQSPC